MARNQKGISHILLPAVLVVAILSIGGVVYHKHQQNKYRCDAKCVAAEDYRIATTPRITNSPKDSTTYTSKKLGVTFNYPSDWTITDKGNGLLTAVSPSVFAHTPTVITLSVRTNAQTLKEFSQGEPTVKMDSVKNAYAHPAQGQRADTYLTAVGFPPQSSTDPRARVDSVDTIYVTGAKAYKKGQKVTLSDISKTDPIISIHFDPDLLTEDLKLRNFFDPLKDIISSFVIN